MNALAVQHGVPPMTPAPRAELDDLTVARARRGEANACRALVERYQVPVFAVLSRMLGKGPHVEDLAQETFLRVFRALPGFRTDGPAKLSTWILTIASRLAIDEMRRRKPIRASLVDAEHVRSERSADEATIRRQQSEQLQRALDELGPDFRATFILSAFHELSHDDIARALDVDVGTVKSRLSRARATLRAALPEVPRVH